MSSGFVSQNEIDEKKQKRQEEWERVRKADEPEQAPEEPYDSRSLFDRLKEQKDKKQNDWDESHKLKNQVKGIDSEEAEFLDRVDAIKWDIERQRIIEERQTIEEYKKIQEQLMDREEQEKKKKELYGSTAKKNNQVSTGTKQSKLLSGVIVRKRNQTSESTEESKKSKPNDSSTEVKVHSNSTTNDTSTIETVDSNSSKDKPKLSNPLGALAGLGSYDSDSNSESE